MTRNNPIRRAVIVLRIWLIMVAGMMTLNAVTASAYVLSESIRPLPFLILAVTALAWSARAWEERVVILCCATLTIGTFLRGLEVLLYAESFPLSQRLTGMSLWWFISGTTLAFGILGLIAASKKLAEEWVWNEFLHSS